MNASTSEPETLSQSTERQVRQCRRMAELAMQLAEAAALQAARQAQTGEKPKGPDPAITFARLTGVIRQSIRLEMKLTAPPPVRRPPAAPPRPQPKPKPPPAPEQYEEPPATEWPFLKQFAQTPPAELQNPVADAPVHTKVAAVKNHHVVRPTAAAAAATPPSDPAKPSWTPPPERRATDPPRPTGPNWASLFER